MKGHNIN